MNYRPYILGTVLGLGAIALIAFARFVSRVSGDEPTVWERQIRKFEKADQHGSPPGGVIVFTGSSSLRFWKSLQEDMAPLPVVNRGFGGSQIHQVTHYADRIVLPYRPRAVVFYAGENDIAGVLFSRKKTPDEVREAYEKFCQKIHSQLPEASIYFISIKPPKLRLNYWLAMQKANKLVQEFCRSDHRLHFIDVVPGMLDADGNPRRDVFKWDGVHLNKKGYAIWTSVVKPVLEEALLGNKS